MAKANWWKPNVSLYANEGWKRVRQDTTIPPTDLNEKIRDRRGGVQLTLPLYRGGKTQAAISAARSAIETAHADYATEFSTISRKTATLYADIFLYSSHLKLIDDWVKDITSSRKRTKEMLAEQRTTVTNLASVESSYASAVSQRASVQSRLRVVIYQLAQLAGHLVKDVALPDSLPWKLPANLEAARDMAMKHSPMILSSQFRSAKAGALVRQAEGGLLPEVSFYSSFERELDGARFTSSTDFTRHNKLDTAIYGIRLTMPIYNGLVLPGIRQAEQHAIEVKETTRQLRLQIRMQLEDAWRRHDAAEQRLSVDKKWLKATIQAFAGMQREFKQGFRTMQDVMTSRTQMFSAEEDIINARHDKFLSAVDVVALTGQLVPEDAESE